jgi:bifunctional UDP-N-acetylglucosamine pyrophosphorylase / glucosamine-1-phosphate N-acetyltransferase
MAIHDVQAVILAAGKSSRFNTGRSKLLEKICGQEMILYLTKLFATMHVPTIAVVGFQKEMVGETIKHHHGDAVTLIPQYEQRGTGHALLCTKDSWQHDTILVVNGDIPLITEEILQRLYQKHQELNAAISIVLAHQADQSAGAYGRLVRNTTYMEIVEANDFKGDPAEHSLINAGIYLIDKKFLLSAINEVQQHHISKEFYIVNLVKIASQASLAVGTIVVPFDQVRGINTLEELLAVEQIKKAELIKHWMHHGVRFYATHNLHLDIDVTIGSGTEIGSGVQLVRGTSIGNNCKINEYVSVSASKIGDHVTVYPFSVITDTTVGDHAQIGPFAHLRAQTTLDAHVAIGNFVEVKNSTINSHTQARHLSYLGDAQIGSGVNIGAGTITCNFDGHTKNTTTIKDNVFVGSNNTLVAPVTIHQNAFTAAGSVITADVPENSLALGRARQVTKEGYAHILRTRLGSKAPSTFVAASTDKQDHTSDV